MATDPRATAIADSLPVTGEESLSERQTSPDFGEEERIDLESIVVTAIEHHEFNHFRVRKYDPDADGVEREWAVIQGLPSAFTDLQWATRDAKQPWPPFVVLDSVTVRKGVEAYLNDRLSKGMDEAEARKMVDGVYTDVVVCDSIIQFALYGEEVFG